MTASDPSLQQEAVNHGDANQSSVDFDVFDHRERALSYKFEERRPAASVPTALRYRSDSSENPSRHIK